MNKSAFTVSVKQSTFALPLLVIVQFLLTIATLGLLAYFKLFSPPVEYPVVIVDPNSRAEYTKRFEGKVTVFDLDDLSEWQYFNDPKATDSAQTGVSFIYPPDFAVTSDPNGSIHVSKNRKDYVVIAYARDEFSENDIPQPYRVISFGSDKKFYQYKKTSADKYSSDEMTIYEGAIDGYGLSITDMEAFSPEVVYMMLMSMTYEE
ncbi:hypothetical protein HY469_02335 [Candidatus Roizmanbacteria bacterium]|nr:hypothetical protein [Candidatus Roizmanbacteria bacterium]